MVVSKHHVLTALPRVDGDGSADTLGAGVQHLVQSVAQSWRGAPPPKLRLLPEQVPLDELRARAPRAPGLLLGIDEAALAPVVLDVRAGLSGVPSWVAWGAGRRSRVRGWAGPWLLTSRWWAEDPVGPPVVRGHVQMTFDDEPAALLTPPPSGWGCEARYD